MTANVDAMIRAGVEAYRAGKRAEARTLLERAIELDNYNEMAWMWLSAVVDSPEEQRTCLENVVVINPNNDRAKQGLRSLGVDPDTIINEAAAQAAADDLQAESIFTDEPVSPSTGSAASNAFSTDDLFADTDFSVEQSFEVDDSLFADESYDDDEDHEDEDYYEDDSYADTGYDNASFLDEGFADTGVHDGDEFYADKTTLENFADAINSGDMDDYDKRMFQRDPFAPEPEPDEAPDPLTFFRQIPKEIEVQRLPGTDEPAPMQHYMMMGGLALVNLIALIFAIMQFLG